MARRKGGRKRVTGGSGRTGGRKTAGSARPTGGRRRRRLFPRRPVPTFPTPINKIHPVGGALFRPLHEPRGKIHVFSNVHAGFHHLSKFHNLTSQVIM